MCHVLIHSNGIYAVSACMVQYPFQHGLTFRCSPYYLVSTGWLVVQADVHDSIFTGLGNTDMLDGIFSAGITFTTWLNSCSPLIPTPGCGRNCLQPVDLYPAICTAQRSARSVAPQPLSRFAESTAICSLFYLVMIMFNSFSIFHSTRISFCCLLARTLTTLTGTGVICLNTSLKRSATRTGLIDHTLNRSGRIC